MFIFSFYKRNRDVAYRVRRIAILRVPRCEGIKIGTSRVHDAPGLHLKIPQNHPAKAAEAPLPASVATVATAAGAGGGAGLALSVVASVPADVTGKSHSQDAHVRVGLGPKALCCGLRTFRILAPEWGSPLTCQGQQSCEAAAEAGEAERRREGRRQVWEKPGKLRQSHSQASCSWLYLDRGGGAVGRQKAVPSCVQQHVTVSLRTPCI